MSKLHLRSVLLFAASASVMAAAASAQNAQDNNTTAQNTAPIASTEAPTTPADTSLGDIVVTAEKQSQNIMKVPASVAVVSGTKVLEQNLTSLQDILKDVPNVSTNSIGFGNTITIRGLGFDLPVGTGEGAVSTTFDGSYTSDVAQSIFGYYDLDRVEVLRGPQGTLYGRNSTGGAVNTISKNPDVKSINGYANFGLMNYKGSKEEGAVNVPLGSMFAVRVAATHINRQGYMRFYSATAPNSAYNGTRVAGDAVGTGIRGKLLFQPSDDASIVFIASKSLIDGLSPNTNVTFANYTAGYPYRSTEVGPGSYNHYRFYKYAADAEVKIGPGELTILPDYERDVNRGFSFNPGAPAFIVQAPANQTQKQKQLEARYASLPGSVVKWTFGGYYYKSDTVSGPSAFAPNGSSFGGTTKAAFGQVTIPFTDSFRGIVGARYSNDGVSKNALNRHFKTFNWKLGLEADLAPDVLTYATLATGSRPGGFNDPGPAATIYGLGFDREKVTSGELGLKGRFFDRHLQLTSAVFYYDYKNYQAVNFVPCVAGYGVDCSLPQNSSLAIFFNVPKAVDYGAEASATVLLGEDTRLTLSGTWLHARYKSHLILAADPSRTSTVDLYDRQLPRSPNYTVSGSLDHTFTFSDASKLTPSVSARWVDSNSLAPFPSLAAFQKAYAVADANLGFTAGGGLWSVNAYVTNIFNKVYKTSAGGPNITASVPRMYGFSSTIRF